MYLKNILIFIPQTLETKEPAFFVIYGYRDFDAYLRLFADAKEEKVVEASTAYLTSPESAA